MRWDRKTKRQLHLEPLQQCVQLAAGTICQLLSHLHPFSQSIMKGFNLFMGAQAPVVRMYEEFKNGIQQHP